MGTQSNVVWLNGAIGPQHFQQQQRYHEYLSSHLLNMLNCYFYGFSHLEINREYLRLGRIGLSSAEGTMPDGTLFELPYQDKSPDPLDIIQINDASSRIIYLALPIRNFSIANIDTAQELKTGSTRFVQGSNDVRDVFGRNGSVNTIPVSMLAPKLIQGSEDLSAYTTLPVCCIKERNPDGTLILDETFIPTCNSLITVPYLYDFLSEVSGLITERAKQLSSRISAPGQQGVADVAEFMMLQLFNRMQPIFIHLAKRSAIHPEDLYRQLVSLCGELMTFTDESRVAPIFAHYDHDNLSLTFHELMMITRRALSIVLTPRAVSIQLTKRSHGISDGVIHDKQLLATSDFIIAVKARVPQDQLFRQFVQQTKISSPNKIRDLVSVQIQGVPLIPLNAAPAQLPHHSGYTYFQLDTQAPAWADIVTNSAIAFHVSGNFPELDMQFWAIRGK
ncbi:type VI secretion system baseplate subunit TssK [Budvicia aquatica]|uniref:Type VI secretion system baseplate subunit TssK n=1 Tax=Budvicia aquatica TaxID=82979 RepID=A0A2C6DT85_9GAMM|nr:type VI secretion system baseplate subunit TssK [Budvicia aquatica]PHI31685.1 type VI secretion system baseplate subunit TssK [Budvicia aquatica]VFS52424.1 Uncharacterized protein conserved in bacteria [Budvicia aquatica]